MAQESVQPVLFEDPKLEQDAANEVAAAGKLVLSEGSRVEPIEVIEEKVRETAAETPIASTVPDVEEPVFEKSAVDHVEEILMESEPRTEAAGPVQHAPHGLLEEIKRWPSQMEIHLFYKKCTCKHIVFIQGCGSGLIYYGSGSSIFAQSGSGSKRKQNFRRQFLSQIFLKSKFESNQIKNTCVIHQNFFQKVVSAILYLFSGKIFVKNN
jgi:hypothetical protein